MIVLFLLLLFEAVAGAEHQGAEVVSFSLLLEFEIRIHRSIFNCALVRREQKSFGGEPNGTRIVYRETYLKLLQEIPWNDYLRRYGYLTPEKNTGGSF